MYKQFSKQSASISLILSPVALAQLWASTPKALTLDQRIAHTDPAKYRHLSAVHEAWASS